MASVALITFAASITLFQAASCKKSDAQDNKPCPTATYPVAGVWIGTYTTNQVPHASTYVSFIIFPDGAFMKRSKVVGSQTEYALTKGTWSLNGNTFQYRDTTITYSGGVVVNIGTATFNNNGTFTNGTWQDVSGQVYTGSYQNMNRVN